MASKSSTWRKKPTRSAACFPTTAAWSSPSARARSKPVTSPGGRTMTHRLARPSSVRDGESSTSSNPSASTKKLIAGSYSLTTIAMRPRCTRASIGDRIATGFEARLAQGEDPRNDGNQDAGHHDGAAVKLGAAEYHRPL